MAYALRSKQNIFTLNLSRPLLPSTDLPLLVYAPNVRGVVVNMANNHWAFRARENNLWLLDSRFPPRVVPYTEYADFLKAYEGRAYAVETWT